MVPYVQGAVNVTSKLRINYTVTTLPPYKKSTQRNEQVSALVTVSMVGGLGHLVQIRLRCVLQ